MIAGTKPGLLTRAAGQLPLIGRNQYNTTIKYIPHYVSYVRAQDQNNPVLEHDFRVSRFSDDILYDMNVIYGTLQPVQRIDILLYKIKLVIR